MKISVLKFKILLVLISLISSEENVQAPEICEGPNCSGGVAFDTVLKDQPGLDNLDIAGKQTIETPGKEHLELGTNIPDTPSVDKILSVEEISDNEQVEIKEQLIKDESFNVILNDQGSTQVKDDEVLVETNEPLLKESDGQLTGLGEEIKSPETIVNIEAAETIDSENTQNSVETHRQQHVHHDPKINQVPQQDGHYGHTHENLEHPKDHIGNVDNSQIHQHNGHPNGHSQGEYPDPYMNAEDQHDHHGHSHGHHGHTHDHIGHSHNQHGHSHNHHGHSHDHGQDDHGHDHSHGIGHLGRKLQNQVLEEIPQHYKPAAQNYDLPLSAQFGTPSPYNYQNNEPSVYATEPPPANDVPIQYQYNDPTLNSYQQPKEEGVQAQHGEIVNHQVSHSEEKVQEEVIQVDPYGKETNAEYYNIESLDINESPEVVSLPEAIGEHNFDSLSTNAVQVTNKVEDSSSSQQINDVHGEILSDKLIVEENVNAYSGENIAAENSYKEHSSSYIPNWLQVIAHENGGLNGDRMALVVIIAVTILMIYLINTFMDQGTRERPLIRRLAEMDKKLFKATNELLIIQSQNDQTSGSLTESGPSTQVVREMEMELQQARLELETSREAVKKEGERSNTAHIELEDAKQEVINAQEETRQAQEMVEELIANQKTQNCGSDDKLMEVVHKLQNQLESQKDMLLKYEPKLKKKEKENKELTKQLKQMRADVANANLQTDKLKKELSDVVKVKDESANKIEEIGKNEDEWKSLADLLQTQLDEKSEDFSNIENELSLLKSRLSVFKNESESKEEQIEVLKETIKVLRTKKLASEEEDGWEVEGEGWNDKEVDEIRDFAVLRVENKKVVEEKETLEKEVCEVKGKLEDTAKQLDQFKSESETLREARDDVVKDHNEVQRKLDVLTEFFNKKEAELQKQLGLQSARFGDANNDAESTARKLISVTSELDSTQDQLKILKGEREDQEKSLKASVAGQEKKAHENWVAARQAERKLTELQGEMSAQRNRLTIVESKNTLLEQEKEDLEGTVTMLKNNFKPELAAGLRASVSVENVSQNLTNTSPTGLNSPSGPETLPPLPGLPGMPSLPTALSGMSLLTSPIGLPPSLFQTGTMLPGMLDIRPPPLGRMSPGPRGGNRSFTSRSPSPEYNSHRGSGRHTNKGGRDREVSPSSRSERRQSPARRGPSPARSERGYRDSRDRHYEADFNRDRHFNNRKRDNSQDRYSSEQSDRGPTRDSHKYREDRGEKAQGHKASSPTESRSYRA